jgi:hypothetical protein
MAVLNNYIASLNARVRIFWPGRFYPSWVLSCRIFEHFATKPDPKTEIIKLTSALPSKVPF